MTSVVGGALGAVLLLALPATAFEALAPFLILSACAVLASQPLLSRRAARRRPDGPNRAEHRSPGLHGVVFGAAVYGGYFGAALGIVLLAVLGLGLDDELHRVNALKGLLSLVIGAVSAAYLLAFGPVVLLAAAIMAGGSVVGGQGGVAQVRHLPENALRGAVVAYGVAAAVVLMAS